VKRTEIRDFGDGNTIVVYTEDKQLHQRLREWKHCQRVVPYESGSATLAVDLYFPKGAEAEIREALRLPAKTRAKAMSIERARSSEKPVRKERGKHVKE